MAIEEIKHECRTCLGSRKTECNKCRSTGEIKCNTCGGGGKMTVRGERENCTNCKGHGTIKCYSCSGHGGHKCSSCKGMGYTVERRVKPEDYKHSVGAERDSRPRESQDQERSPIALVAFGLLALFAALFGAWFTLLR